MNIHLLLSRKSLFIFIILITLVMGAFYFVSDSNAGGAHQFGFQNFSNFGNQYLSLTDYARPPHSGEYYVYAEATWYESGGAQGQGYTTLCIYQIGTSSGTQCVSGPPNRYYQQGQAGNTMHVDCQNNGCNEADVTGNIIQTVDYDVYAHAVDTSTPQPPPPPPPPPPPGSFNLSGSCSVVDSTTNRANLSWSSSSGATQYRIYRRIWSSGSWQSQGTTAARSWNQNVRNSEDVYYEVWAENSVGDTDSNQGTIFVCGAVSSTPTPTPNSPPDADIRCNNSGGSCSITSGQTVNIEWCGSGHNTCAGAQSCTVTYPGGSYSGTSGNKTTTIITSSQTYTLKCTNPYGTNTDTVDVIVGGVPAPPPTPTPAPVPCTENSDIIMTGTTLPSTLTLAPGQVYTFSVEYENIGDTWWWTPSAYSLRQTSASPYSINIPSQCGGAVTGANYGDICSSVAVGERRAWTFELTAPSTPSGPNTFSMQMRHAANYQSINDASRTSCLAPQASDSFFGDTLTSSITVRVPQPPTADIKCSTNSNGSGQTDSCNIGYNTNAYLFWTSIDATECSVRNITSGSYLIPPGGPPPGGPATQGAPGIDTGALTVDTTYEINCTGPVAESNIEDTLTVNVTAPTLSANLTSLYSKMGAGQSTNLTATTGGTAVGTINYSLWWNCTHTGSSVSNVTNGVGGPVCGALPVVTSPPGCVSDAVGYKCEGVSTNPLVIPKSYSVTGAKTAKVIIERGILAATDSTNITVVGGMISGYVYEDQNTTTCCAGVFDVGEVPFVGEEVQLTRQSDGLLVDKKFTDSSGYYEFTGLPSDTYIVTHSVLAGYSNTTEASKVLTIP